MKKKGEDIYEVLFVYRFTFVCVCVCVCVGRLPQLLGLRIYNVALGSRII